MERLTSPSIVFTHVRRSSSQLPGPPSVTVGRCSLPASVTPRKQASPAEPLDPAQAQLVRPAESRSRGSSDCAQSAEPAGNGFGSRGCGVPPAAVDRGDHPPIPRAGDGGGVPGRAGDHGHRPVLADGPVLPTTCLTVHSESDKLFAESAATRLALLASGLGRPTLPCERAARSLSHQRHDSPARSHGEIPVSSVGERFLGIAPGCWSSEDRPSPRRVSRCKHAVAGRARRRRPNSRSASPSPLRLSGEGSGSARMRRPIMNGRDARPALG